MIVLFLLLALIPKYPAFYVTDGTAGNGCNCQPQAVPQCPPIPPPILPPIPPPLPPPIPPPIPPPPQLPCPPPISQPCPPPPQIPCLPPLLPPLPPPTLIPPPAPCPPCLPSPATPCPPPLPLFPGPQCKRKKRSTPVAAAVASEYDTNGHALCNDNNIRKIILKNLSSDAKVSKAAIYSELKMKQKGDYVVLCSQSSLSFTSDSTNYCVGSNTDHLCYVFQL